MTDQELRTLVREAVARHLGQGAVPRAAHAAEPDAAVWARHSSHALYLTVVNTSESCFIEPSTACDHCGYCKSHGH